MTTNTWTSIPSTAQGGGRPHLQGTLRLAQPNAGVPRTFGAGTGLSGQHNVTAGAQLARQTDAHRARYAWFGGCQADKPRKADGSPTIPRNFDLTVWGFRVLGFRV